MKQTEKNKYIKLFTKAIKNAEKLKSTDIGMREFVCEDDSNDFYVEFDYQIDDRNDNRGYDKDIQKKIEKELGPNYSVDVNRVDAYPNGYAYYVTTIYKN